MAITEEQLKDFELWIKETDRIDELYKDLKPSEIRELVREFCGSIVANMTLEDIVAIGDSANPIFHIDLDYLDDKIKKYEVDIVLDYKHDQTYQEEMNND